MARRGPTSEDETVGLPGPRGGGVGRRRALTGVLVAAAVLLPGCSFSPTSPSSIATLRVGPAHPNIVFVLTDDLAGNLVQYMPHVLALQRNGMSFSNYTVTDSLCCPSRSSILTGDYPHDTGVFTNSPPLGGYAEFRAHGDEQNTFAVALQKAGYRTAFMGKYLNGYHPGVGGAGPRTRVPPGWDEWDGVGYGYPEYGYRIAHDTSSRSYGYRPQDYLTSVLARRATAFIGSAASSRSPFFLEVATFAPHRPFVPAPTDTAAFPGLRAPRSAAYDVLPTDPPAWLRGRRPLTTAEKARIDRDYRLRAQDVLSVDRLLGSIEAALRSAGASRDTVIVFSSDNGYHMGEYRLTPGKMTAFDTDVTVPLVVAGPGIPAGTTTRAVVQNVDLAPTFESWAGVPPNPGVDGRSLLGLLHGDRLAGWTTAALIEHRGPDTDPTDPDHQPFRSGNPPSYEAIRTATYTYVEYATGAKEYYDRVADPLELHNVFGQLSVRRKERLHRTLRALETCHGAAACTVARAAG